MMEQRRMVAAVALLSSIIELSTSTTTTTTAARPTTLPTTVPDPTTALLPAIIGPTTPVPGFWSEWGRWRPCSGICEWGSRSRTRTCPGGYCLGNSSQVELCDIALYCDFGGWSVWGPYEPYSACNKPCGVGQMTAMRRRNCDTPADGCEGIRTNYTVAVCNIHPCYVNGKWSEWRAWSETSCSSTCGFGTSVKTRLRTCTDPQPSGGGRMCAGDKWQSYNVACKNLEDCEVTTPMLFITTVPPAFNPTIYIIVPILVGVPVLVGIYCTVGALIRAFCIKPKPIQKTRVKQNTRIDYDDDDEEWSDGIITISQTINMENDAYYREPRPLTSSNVYTTVL